MPSGDVMPSESTAPTRTGTGAARWLDDTEMAAWLGIVEVVPDLMSALETDLAPFGLNLGDYQVFVHLSAADDGSMRMCDLATLLHLTPSGLTRRLDGLVRDGWVERHPSAHDRRVMLAVLTPAGRARLEQVAPAHVASVRSRFIDLLGHDTLAVLGQAFVTIRAGLDATEDDRISE